MAGAVSDPLSLVDPVPEDVTGVDTYHIVRQIRCESREAIRLALINWLADVACLVCAIKAVGEPVPWATILIVWTAGVSAASFSPVPAGLGIVDIVLITALATAGLPGKYAIAAALVYRAISLKVGITLAWLLYHHLAARRRAHVAESVAARPGTTAPLRGPVRPTGHHDRD